MGTIMFSFNDEKDPDELTRAKRAMHADDAFSLLYDISQKLRDRRKYNDTISDDEHNFIEEVESMIHTTGLLEMYE